MTPSVVIVVVGIVGSKWLRRDPELSKFRILGLRADGAGIGGPSSKFGDSDVA